MMLRLTVDIPSEVEVMGVGMLTTAALNRQGITITDSYGVKLDVDLVNVDVTPEGRLVQ